MPAEAKLRGNAPFTFKTECFVGVPAQPGDLGGGKVTRSLELPLVSQLRGVGPTGYQRTGKPLFYQRPGRSSPELCLRSRETRIVCVCARVPFLNGGRMWAPGWSLSSSPHSGQRTGGGGRRGAQRTRTLSSPEVTSRGAPDGGTGGGERAPRRPPGCVPSTEHRAARQAPPPSSRRRRRRGRLRARPRPPPSPTTPGDGGHAGARLTCAGSSGRRW